MCARYLSTLARLRESGCVDNEPQHHEDRRSRLDRQGEPIGQGSNQSRCSEKSRRLIRSPHRRGRGAWAESTGRPYHKPCKRFMLDASARSDHHCARDRDSVSMLPAKMHRGKPMRAAASAFVLFLWCGSSTGAQEPGRLYRVGVLITGNAGTIQRYTVLERPPASRSLQETLLPQNLM